jgi:hypothetical protein
MIIHVTVAMYYVRVVLILVLVLVLKQFLMHPPLVTPLFGPKRLALFVRN